MRSYTAKTSRGREITVWFLPKSESNLFQAIAASESLSTGYYFKKGYWKPALTSVAQEWNPTVAKLYRQYLADILEEE